MTKTRIAAIITVAIAGAIAIVVALTNRSDTASESNNASSSSTASTPAPEPPMTTELIPQPRQEGIQPPPSDVAGISKPEGEPKR
jgi:hypothetical protein